MQKLVFLLCFVVLAISCTDEFNLPEYEGIDDNESPVILVNSPTENQVITGQNSVDIKVNFTDDYQLDQVQFQLVPNNFNSPGISMTKLANDSMFSIDTTYTFPSSDSIQYDVLIIAGDLVGNVTTESYQFTSK